MTTLSDTLIIDNTHFEVDETERLICYTNLPDGSRFAQAVSSQEAVQKNMIGWCNTVREFLRAKEREEEEEKMAARSRRQATPSEAGPPTPSTPTPATVNAKQLVLAHWEGLKEKRRDLKEALAEGEAELERINNEMDELKPVIQAWKGVKGES